MIEVRVVLFGAGRVGRDLTKLISARPGFRIVAAHSRDPTLAGKDLGKHAGIERLGVPITNARDAVLAHPADVLVIATTSFLQDVADDIRAAIAARLNVVSSAEELAFPWVVDGRLAEDLDRSARKAGVTILGAGVNPGYISDALVLTLTGAAWDVDRIDVSRVVNLSRFSATILRRLGVGFTPTDFETGVATGTIFGHVGFPQSIALVARALGVEVDRTRKTFLPLVAQTEYRTAQLEVPPGLTAGFTQAAEALVADRVWFRAELTGHLDPEAAGFDPVDTIAVNGLVPLRLVARPGFAAQRTVAAVLANSLRRVLDAPPGLLTVADIPPAIAQPTLADRLHGMAGL